MKNLDICIVSGNTRLRLPSAVNHKVYAELHDADYRLECGPIPGLTKPIRYFKLLTLRHILPRYDWVLWLDDDAFFTNFRFDLRQLIRSASPDVNLIMGDGRVRPDGPFTVVNAGVVLLKNCQESLVLLDRCVSVQADPGVLENWWNPSVHGMYTHSDQDALIYVMLETLKPSAYQIVPHAQLNAREYHYRDRLDECFICHFPGAPDRLGAVRRFADRFGVGPSLVPSDVLKEVGFDWDPGADVLSFPKRSLIERLAAYARRRLR